MSNENKAAREIETGGDVAYEVAKWERYLAASEARHDGAFADAASHEPAFAREVFARLYDGPRAIEGCEDERYTAAHAALDDVPEFSALRARVEGDPWACGLVAADMVREMVEQGTFDGGLDNEIRTEVEDENPGAGEDEIAALVGQGISDRLRRAVAARVDESDEALDDVDAVVGFLGGSGAAEGLTVAAPRDALRRFAVEHPALARIIRLAGRMKATSDRKRAKWSTDAVGEVCDVETSADYARALPSELALLGNATLRPVFYRRLTERGLATYKVRGKVAEERGPVALLVDESSSMTGAPNEWAKAATLAVIDACQRERRALTLVPFSSIAGLPRRIEPGKRFTLDEVRGIMTGFMNGGTKFSPALSRVEVGAEDVILVTDGQNDYMDVLAAKSEVARLRDGGATIFGVGIGTEVSDVYVDESIRLDGLGEDGEDAVELIGRVSRPREGKAKAS